MDKQSFGRLLSCGVCLEIFDQATKRPRILGCGHSFCHSCLNKILIQSPCCPNCNASILFTSVESIPINFSLESLSSLRLHEGHKRSPENDYVEIKKQVDKTVEKVFGERKASLNMPPPPRYTRAKTPSAIESLRSLCSQCSQSGVCAVDDSGDTLLYGKIRVKGKKVWVYSFQKAKPRGSSVLLSVTPEFSDDAAVNVVIKTDGLSPGAKNFILHASALKEHSYKGMSLKLTSGYCSYQMDPVPPFVVAGINSNVSLFSPQYQKGDVYYLTYNDNVFLLIIQLKDAVHGSSNNVGVVAAGLQNLISLDGDCTVTECGLVI